MPSDALPTHRPPLTPHPHLPKPSTVIRVFLFTIVVLCIYRFQPHRRQVYHAPYTEIPMYHGSEAYVTFLSDIESEPWYAHSTRLLLFQLLHDPLTRDIS